MFFNFISDKFLGKFPGWTSYLIDPQRDACGVCSLCKRGALEDCIDKYCSEEETGRLQRAHMKELYLKFLEVAPKRDNQMCCSRGHQTNPIKEVNT